MECSSTWLSLPRLGTFLLSIGAIMSSQHLPWSPGSYSPQPQRSVGAGGGDSGPQICG
ncbi:uncharacterized protein BO72DRAFT_451660 [Aspergillus fijiensis CBS 313.89]|uniref:Uncharacterized protein n=1 Tax=Aspergillus fijiensis CBS 313.89 TaxID=1448319 RepID=A0A8G1RJV5_9EURO|nr:uncharacterized protein BO72DRAFT_451660 [Aspergillus fijiensis CBS 313.89]RAK73478.1 hypothetical protein BO72DRAFT_451660 [Aspergillus fijiensis CBS 313.89]